MRKISFFKWFLVAFFCMTSLNAKEVNIYVERDYAAYKEISELFVKESGIRANFIVVEPRELFSRMQNESKNPNADLFIISNIGAIDKVKSAGLTQKVISKVLDKEIPSYLRDNENEWFGIAKRARIIVYAKDRINPTSIKTYDDLTKPEFKGKVLIRSSSNIYNQALLASMIKEYGEVGAKKWALGMVNNFAREPKGNDRDQARDVVNKIGDVAVMNNYYLGFFLQSKDEKDVNVAKALGVIFPNQESSGTFINITGAGILKGAKNYDNAVKFLEFLANSAKAQTLFVRDSNEYPVNPKATPNDTVSAWGTFKESTIDMNTIAKNSKKAVDIFNKVNWK
ncbi:MAG: extracellular solute-binding protein [Campylobacteraceae bacterium]